jgi:hypothetical protein
MNTTILNLLNQYLETINKESRGSKIKRKGYRSKRRVINFLVLNGRWPTNYKAATQTERLLGRRFNNYISKMSLCYDERFREIVLMTGFKARKKPKHDVSGMRIRIMDFVEKHGRMPTNQKAETIAGEGVLRRAFDYYVKRRNDMSLLGFAYANDPCHLSGIPMKYRTIINEALDTEKPLIKLV